MRRVLLLVLLLMAACSDQRPPAPSAEENARLDETEAMLNNLDQSAK